jgi:hypothetical protein
MKRHVVIAGPGRAGTTLLVRLLDRVGLDIGTPTWRYYEGAKAGLETDLLAPDAPYVVKKPDLTWQLRGLFEAGTVDPASIEWLVIPLRDLSQAAASRVAVSVRNRSTQAAGGVILSRWPGRQQADLAKATYGLLETAALYEIPLITLEYPRFARDSGYAWRRLRPVLDGVVDEISFADAWLEVVDPSLVRNQPIAVPGSASITLGAIRFRKWAKSRLDSVRDRLSHG